jgi:subtilisin
MVLRRSSGTRRQPLATLVLLLALLAGVAPAALTGHAVAGAQEAQAKRSVIVELARGTDPKDVARKLGVTPTFVYEHVINGFAAELPASALDALQKTRGVLGITPDRPVEAFGRHRKQNQKLPTGINRIDADQSTLSAINRDGGTVDTDVAVLDTGIANHPELNIVGGTACVGNKGYADGNGHGTHVSGTIGARDNSSGVVGVAPGVRLWAVKVLDDQGSGTYGSIICGLDYVANHSATIDVINMSLGGGGSDSVCGTNTDAFHDAICNVFAQGVTVIVAAGNESRDAANTVPATYDEVITVSAITDFDGKPGGVGVSTCRNDGDDTFANYSNFGADVDISAPGTCIRSTWLNGGYQVISGTSMATPHVTGAAALYISTNQNATPADVRAFLLGASCPQSDQTCGLVTDDDPDNIPEPVLYLGRT